MNKSLEQEIILLLVDRHHLNKERCLELLEQPLDWEYVLGFLSYNRVAGVAYQTILACNPHEDNINREFRLGLFLLHNIQSIRTKAFRKYIFEIEEVLNNYVIPHAFLKGAVLANSIYPEGCRISNDIDLLISEEYLNQATLALKEIGFIQGTYDINSHSVIPATRKEVLHCRMNFGELMSFIRPVDEPGINMILTDVNFSLEAHGLEAQAVVQKYLANLEQYPVEGHKITSLSVEYFIAHLCIHFYKEAADLRWVEKQRDMCLYKVIDLYEVFLSDKLNIDKQKFIALVEEEGIQTEVYYTLKIASDIFESLKNVELVQYLLKTYQPTTNEIMYIVNDVKASQDRYLLELDTIERLFNIKRFEKITKLKVRN